MLKDIARKHLDLVKLRSLPVVKALSFLMGKVHEVESGLATIQLIKGDKGDSIVGPKGDTGERGAPGETVIGPRGERGEVGPMGPVGPQGERGDIGPIGLPGKDGTNGLEGAPGKPGSDGSPDMADDIRNKLELLTGDERLNKSAIKGVEEIEKDVAAIKARPATVAGRSLLQLYVDGAKKGPIQYLNLIPGTGVTFTYSRASGRNDITINATGGGGGGSLSVLTATGTVNDVNTTFTFASAPTLVVVNGASYRNGFGCTITGTSVVLDNAPGTGGDVYGLGA